MKQYQRAALALSVLRLEAISSKNNVYDYSLGRHWSISGKIDQNEIKLYDYDRGAHFGGRLNGQRYSLYDFEHSEHISLELKSSGKYGGYHFGSATHYEITVRSNGVSFYDFGTGQFYNFS